jgi:hypothetical protein
MESQTPQTDALRHYLFGSPDTHEVWQLCERLERELNELKGETKKKVSLLPLWDRDGKKMYVGDSFLYQVGSPHESVVTIVERDGEEWLVFVGRTKAITVEDFWFHQSDSKISKRL